MIYSGEQNINFFPCIVTYSKTVFPKLVVLMAFLLNFRLCKPVLLHYCSLVCFFVVDDAFDRFRNTSVIFLVQIWLFSGCSHHPHIRRSPCIFVSYDTTDSDARFVRKLFVLPCALHAQKNQEIVL